MAAAKKTFVLNVGKEKSFLDLRHRLLTDAGYAVRSAESVEEAQALVQSRRIDVLVVGAWVSKAERMTVVRQTKSRHPDAMVIFYYDQNIDDTEAADAILNFRGDHTDLVRTVRHLQARATKQERGGVSRRMRDIAGVVVAAIANPLLIAAAACL